MLAKDTKQIKKELKHITFLIDTTIKHLLEEFIQDRQVKNCSLNTIKTYRSQIELFIKWLLDKDIDIEVITSDILRRYFLFLGEHKNQGGVYFAYQVLKVLFNWYEFEYEPEVWKNPIKKVKVSPNHIEPLPGIPIENIQKLIDNCEGRYKLRDTAILKCLLDTGCRASEFLALNIEDINLLNGAVIIKHGKGDKRRIVYLGEKSRKALRRYLKSRDNMLISSPLWVNEDGDRLKFSGLRQIIIRLSKRANIPVQGLHSFRRTFALTLYRKNVDIFSISELLGHSNIEITKRYLNIDNEDLRRIHSNNSPSDSLN